MCLLGPVYRLLFFSSFFEFSRAFSSSQRPAQRGGRGRAVRQRVGPAGRGDESDSEDSLILDLAGGDDGDAGHPGSGDEGAGGDAALHGQPVGAMAQVGALRVCVRIMLGGRPAPGVHPGQGGGHRGLAAVDWWAEAPKSM